VIFENAEMNALVSIMEEFGVYHLSLNKIALQLHLAVITGRHKAYYLRIYKSGKVLNGNISVCNILLDSGATHASYISKELIDKYMDIWNGYIR
jgi:hypothetical protein